MKTKKGDLKKIMLNHPCKICHGIIYIGNGSIIEGEPLHFQCFKEEGIQEEKAEAIKEELGFLHSLLGIIPEKDFESEEGYIEVINDRITEIKSKIQSPNKSETGSNYSGNSKQVQTGSDAHKGKGEKLNGK